MLTLFSLYAKIRITNSIGSPYDFSKIHIICNMLQKGAFLMKKNIFILFLSLCILLCTFPVSAADAKTTVNVTVNGVSATLTSTSALSGIILVAPYAANGSYTAPIQTAPASENVTFVVPVATNYARIFWFDDLSSVHPLSKSQIIDFKTYKKKIQLTAGDKKITVNGSTVTLDNPPLVVDGTLCVPIEFVSKQVSGAKVTWSSESKNQIIFITKNSKIIIMSIGSNLLLVTDIGSVSEKRLTYSSTPTLQNDTPYIPVEYLVDALNMVLCPFDISSAILMFN